MNRENITQLIGQKNFPVETNKVDLIETHISWVIVCDQFVYKIKKPKKYSFLDYSTLTKRKYFCEKEVELNKRLTTGIYLRVTPVRKALFKYFIDGSVGEIIDYAVTMRKLPEERRMDKLLLQNNVSTTDIKNLAAKISAFHKTAHVIREESHSFLKELFNDLLTQKNYLQQYDDCALLINDALKASNKFF